MILFVYKMVRRRQKSARKKTVRQSRGIIGSSSRAMASGSDDAVKYTGSVHPPGWITSRSVTARELRYVANATSTAGGVLASVYDQSMNLFTNWTNLAAVWDEYRVLKYVVEYMPGDLYNRANASTTVPGYVVIDRDSNLPLTSTGSAIAYESCRVYSLDLPWVEGDTVVGTRQRPPFFCMDGVNDAQWINTAGIVSSTKPCVKMYFTGLGATITYGSFLVRALVQFRGTF